MSSRYLRLGVIFFENRVPRKKTLKYSKTLCFFPSFLDALFLFWKTVEDHFLDSWCQNKLFFSGMAGLGLAYDTEFHN